MNPIQSLQHMLNQLARTTSTLPRLAETGTFDEATLETVMIFQRDHGLPVTGIVDQQTWDNITDTYYSNLFRSGVPHLLHVLPNGTEYIRELEYDTAIYIVQAILTALDTAVSNFEAVELNGINSSGTTRNLRQLQELSGLETTGSLDRSTWAILSHLYRALITRRLSNTSPL